MLVFLEDLVAAFPDETPGTIKSALSGLLSAQRLFMLEYDDGQGREDFFFCSAVKKAHLKAGGAYGDPV